VLTAVWTEGSSWCAELGPGAHSEIGTWRQLRRTLLRTRQLSKSARGRRSGTMRTSCDKTTRRCDWRVPPDVGGWVTEHRPRNVGSSQSYILCIVGYVPHEADSSTTFHEGCCSASTVDSPRWVVHGELVDALTCSTCRQQPHVVCASIVWAQHRHWHRASGASNTEGERILSSPDARTISWASPVGPRA
jgi:hypothetical protein